MEPHDAGDRRSAFRNNYIVCREFAPRITLGRSRIFEQTINLPVRS